MWLRRLMHSESGGAPEGNDDEAEREGRIDGCRAGRAGRSPRPGFQTDTKVNEGSIKGG